MVHATRHPSTEQRIHALEEVSSAYINTHPTGQDHERKSSVTAKHQAR